MDTTPLADHFLSSFGQAPAVIATAPGRLEVLGNHTDYNAGLTLSCAVGFRCAAAICSLDTPEIQLASTAFGGSPEVTPLLSPIEYAASGHWTNYILGLVGALQERGHSVPGFAMLIDSAVPRSAGVSSSAALEMAALTGLAAMMKIDLPPIEFARIGQWAESRAVGAQTGLLDQLTSLCGQAEHLLYTDFQSIEHHTIAMPPGWVFVAVDSGVKHDLTTDYNDRRASCEAAAKAVGAKTLREVSMQQLEAGQNKMDDAAYHCATHILGESQRVSEALDALAHHDVERLGELLFVSHESSRVHFRNSCAELDELIEHAKQDTRCIGARLSGGGFGGISIHLVRADDAPAYLEDLLRQLDRQRETLRWSAICEIDDGACVVESA